MKLALLKSGPLSNNDMRWLINEATGRKGYCHTELVFADGSSFSSLADESSVDSKGNKKQDGTRFTIPGQIDFTDAQTWTVVGVPGVSEAQESLIKIWCSQQLDARYDWWGVMACGHVPLAREHPDDWFCSEVCTAALETVMQPTLVDPSVPKFIIPWQTSPNDMAVYFGAVK